MAWWNPIDWISGVNREEARGEEIDAQIAAYNDTLRDRYAPGGDIYNKLANQYGPAGAERVYSAYLSGGDVAGAIAELRYGTPLEDSTLKLFGTQLATDPFGAPLDAADNYIGTNITNALRAVLRSPWVVLLVGTLLVIYFWPVLRPIAGRLAKQLR